MSDNAICITKYALYYICFSRTTGRPDKLIKAATSAYKESVIEQAKDVLLAETEPI